MLKKIKDYIATQKLCSKTIKLARKEFKKGTQIEELQAESRNLRKLKKVLLW